MEANLHAAQFELEHWRHALNALDHARRDRRQEQLSRIEGIGATTHICVQDDRGAFGGCLAA
jgi:hypothetical protein